MNSSCPLFRFPKQENVGKMPRTGWLPLLTPSCSSLAQTTLWAHGSVCIVCGLSALTNAFCTVWLKMPHSLPALTESCGMWCLYFVGWKLGGGWETWRCRANACMLWNLASLWGPQPYRQWTNKKFFSLMDRGKEVGEGLEKGKGRRKGVGTEGPISFFFPLKQWQLVLSWLTWQKYYGVFKLKNS